MRGDLEFEGKWGKMVDSWKLKEMSFEGKTFNKTFVLPAKESFLTKIVSVMERRKNKKIDTTKREAELIDVCYQICIQLGINKKVDPQIWGAQNTVKIALIDKFPTLKWVDKVGSKKKTIAEIPIEGDEEPIAQPA